MNDDFDLVSRSQVCQKYKLQIELFRFMPTVVLTLHNCYKYMHLENRAQYYFCDSDGYSEQINNMFLVSPVSGLVENFNIGIFLDAINLINVRLCMMVLLIELYLFIPHSVTLTIFQDIKQF